MKLKMNFIKPCLSGTQSNLPMGKTYLFMVCEKPKRKIRKATANVSKHITVTKQSCR